MDKVQGTPNLSHRMLKKTFGSGKLEAERGAEGRQFTGEWQALGH